MRSTLILSVLSLSTLIGCVDAPEAELSDDVEIEDTGYMPEDTDDENGYELGQIEELPEQDQCSFDVPAWIHQGVQGYVEMENELQITLSADSPSGWIDLEGTGYYFTVAMFDITAIHADCSDITIGSMSFGITATDNAGSGWDHNIEYLVAWDLDTGYSVGAGNVYATSEMFSAFAPGLAGYEGLTIEAGQTKTISIMMRADGASMEMDDMVRIDWLENIGLSDDGEQFHSIIGESIGLPVMGGTLVF